MKLSKTQTMNTSQKVLPANRSETNRSETNKSTKGKTAINEAENVSTIQRVLSMLRFLPYIPNERVESHYHTGKTTRQILTYLQDLDFQASIRTVQRDLSQYSNGFPITEYKRHWYWSSDPYGLSGLPDTDALTLHLLEKNLKALLPIQFFKGLSSRFRVAEQHLAFMEEGNVIRRWSEKVRYVSPNLNLLTPKIIEDVHEKVQKALFHEQQLQIDYQSASSDHPSTQQLHPLGLIQSGNLLYLVALHNAYLHLNEPRLYALHRINTATILDAKAAIPNNFSLDNYIKNGGMDFAIGESIKLVARMTREMRKHVMETPFSEDQIIEVSDDPSDRMPYRLSATVFDSLRLRWWLLSYTADICVEAPLSLRETLVEKLKIGLYN